MPASVQVAMTTRVLWLLSMILSLCYVCLVRGQRRRGLLGALVAGWVLVGSGCGWTAIEPSSTTSTAGSQAAMSAQPGKTTDGSTLIDSIGVAVPDGEIVLTPAGPYQSGQVVTLLADSDEAIDLNTFPRLCARVGDAPEFCAPAPLASVPISDPPAGTHGVTIELRRRHLGPTGEHDCGDPDTNCRVLWRTETSRLLVSPSLSFAGEEPPIPTVTLEATAGPDPGTVTLLPGGIDPNVPPASLLTDLELASILQGTGAVIDPNQLRIGWELGPVCGLGEGAPPIGSEDLVDEPSWWHQPSLQPTADGSTPAGLFGPICDYGPPSVAIDQDNPSRPITVQLHRDIYGFGGWLDCAHAPCYIELMRRWSFPLPDGSTISNTTPVARTMLNIPTDSARQRPTITVLESGPYRHDQTVTVEVHGYQGDDLMAITWCPGGDKQCTYLNDTAPVDGALRGTWSLPGPGSGCGPNRCYFAINSNGEGLAPPAIALVSLDD